MNKSVLVAGSTTSRGSMSAHATKATAAIRMAAAPVALGRSNDVLPLCATDLVRLMDVGILVLAVSPRPGRPAPASHREMGDKSNLQSANCGIAQLALGSIVKC